MVMNIKYVFVLLALSIAFSCSDKTSEVCSQKNPEISIKVSSLVNEKELKLNQFMSFNGQDSILVSRLDFYIQHCELINKANKKSNMDTALLFSLNNSQNIMYKKDTSIPTTIDTIKFLCGLDDFVNGGNPNNYPSEHPLSSWKNMYWTSWSKYRFIVFEGKIKKASGELISYSYHTGLTYKNYGKIPVNISLCVNNSKTYNLKLNIEKIFSPSTGNPILYNTGETQAHADLQDAELTAKFANNFAQAFSFE